MRIHSALTLMAGLACALQVAAAVPAPPQILVLSNRADLVSGGDALVEIKWPAGTNVALAKVAVDNVNVKPAFALRPNGRYMGIVSGLKNGANVLTARVPGAGSQITIVNHPSSGPVFAGAQLNPWICATKVAKTVTVTGNPGSTPPTANVTTKASGLNDDPTDDSCSTPPTYTYYYQPAALEGSGCVFNTSGTNACFTPYDPASRPADSAIANFTNDRGDVVKSLIRVERGTINRTIYQLVGFFDPKDANTPWTPAKGWNGKLEWMFGPSAGSSRFEQPPAVSLFGASGGVALSRGFMVATSSLTDHGTNSNDTLAAETVMMVKERISENYGQIRYTIGDGCSGGSIMQQSIASAYPGLIDGIQPECSFPDTFTTFIEISDCGDVQAHYYTTANGGALTTTQRSAINGHKNIGFCSTWISQYLPAGDPARAGNCGSGFPAALAYNKQTNPHGIRCDGTDHDVALVGTFVDTDGITKANGATDNVGIQYGLKALHDGVIAPEDFVRLNEGVGGYDSDLVWNASSRSRANPDVLRTYYTGGLVSDGRQLAKLPIIDLRGNESAAGDIHANWRPWAVRDRLDRDHGGHANQLIFAYNSSSGSSSPGAALVRKAFLTMDTWLAAIEADTSSNPIEVKVVNNKPSGATDLCLQNVGTTDADVAAAVGLDDAACPVKHEATPRQAAGGPVAENIFKCSLKPLQFGDPAYGGVTFSNDQQGRLAAVFPDGVCDWNQPGVGQVPVNPWTTFVAGPGGQPLGASPVAVAIP
ncbi:MAG: hypothetical protein JWP52_373 [Rhizobacter sp.]|nr:hypothetical protein [Rhizobacter sp.]